MNSPNNDVITANKIHRPILAGGRLSAPSASRSSGDPGVSHGLAVSLLASRPQTTTPARRATNATEDSRLDSVRRSGGYPSLERLVLRYEIFFGARYAVVISPTIDHRQLCTPVAMLRWRVGCLPFEGRSPPGVAAARLALGETPNQVE